MPSIANGDRIPTILVSRGAMIRKPLPIMEESGVRVALQSSFFSNPDCTRAKPVTRHETTRKELNVKFEASTSDVSSVYVLWVVR